MKRHLRLPNFCAVMGGANAGLAVVDACRGKWLLFALNTSAALVNVFIYLLTLRRNNHGQHRQAEEGARDPGAFATGGAVSADAIARALAAFPSAQPASPGVELERVESDLPILAHRVARLVFGEELPFLPYTDRGGFGIDAEAHCNRPWSMTFLLSDRANVPPHDAPGVDCSCGFHALPPDVEPWGSGPELVTLLVELSGTVVEHERGYRAQHQRVVEVQLPPCPYCGGEAEWVRTDRREVPTSFGSVLLSERMVGAACNRHRDGDEKVTVDDVRRLLGVPVTCRSLPVPKEVEQ